MEKVRLGKTDLYVTKPAFGALPIQRICTHDAVDLLRKAYDAGINYFDTANAYTDSEEKIGLALHDVRAHIVISTKSAAGDKQTAMRHIETSLRRLRTDYIDLFQFHNPSTLPQIDDENGAFAAALEAQKKGYIRHIGITNHRRSVALQAIESGNFATLQFPFCYLSSQEDLALASRCKQADMGFIAMKGLSGGMITNARASHAFMAAYENVVPIWGIQYAWELDEWLALAEENPSLDDALSRAIEKDKRELAGNFCRSCGYCLPCSVGIDIPQAARMAMLLRRSPYQPYMSDEWYAKMHQIEQCTNCFACKSRCPYELDIPVLLRMMLKDYDAFYKEHQQEKIDTERR